MPRHNEDAEQSALFEWASYYPVLRWLHHIPNGGKRDAREGARLKAQGVKPGVADIFLPMARQIPCELSNAYGGVMENQNTFFHGLYIEMKRRREDGRSGVSQNQADFGKAMQEAGYDYRICYGADEAIQVIKKYANL